MSDVPAPATVTVSGLWVYPIKSCAAVALPAARLEATGLRFDRRWMLVDDDGVFLTQRNYPQMARIAALPTNDGLTVRQSGQANLELPTVPDAALYRRTVQVWRFTGEAMDEGEVAARWFSDALGIACRLVRTPEDFARRVKCKFAPVEDPVSFADGYPSLVTSDASLADLNAHLGEPVPMDRFRPNITVAGAPAWDEETWTHLDGPDGIRFCAAKPCARCAVTTVDQVRGTKTGSEPLATLAKLRPHVDGKVNFGMNLTHEAGRQSVLHIGDTLHIHR